MAPGDLFASARFKINRASEHIREFSETLREKRPFRYILETNAATCQRSIGAEKNEAVVAELAIICGDAVHNLRSALDHAYAAVVLPFAMTDRERRAVQFPFSDTEAKLQKAVENRLANRVSPQFFDTIMHLRPHGEARGNRLLYLIHALDIPDKHTSFIPTADYKTLTGRMIHRFAPDCPLHSNFAMRCGQGERDIVWEFYLPGMVSWQAFGFPEHGILRQEVDVPVEIVFDINYLRDRIPIVPTLHKFVDLTKGVVDIISGFA